MFGDGEDDVVVIDGQQFSLPVFEPLGAGQILAFGAMAVTAGVIRDSLLTTVTTGLHMPAQGGSPARLDGCHQTVLMPGQGMLCAELLAVGPEDGGHLEGWRRHEG